MIDKTAKDYIMSILGYRRAPLIQKELNTSKEGHHAK